MANRTDGKKRANARKELAAIRKRISDMNTQQLQGFFKGFSAKDRARFVKAIDRVNEKIAEAEMESIDKQIEQLQQRKAELTS